MKKLFVLFLLGSVFVQAQITYDGPAQGSISSGYILTTENAPLVSAVPKGRTRFILHNKPFVQPDTDKVVSPSRIGENYINLDKGNSLAKSLSSEIVVFKSFKGIQDNGYIPPDPYLAVGPNHIILAVNTEFKITDKQGRELASIDASDWFETAFPGLSIADPKVIYDQFDERWVIVFIDVRDNSSEAYFIVSVSDDSNPLGKWYTWWLPSHWEGSTPSGKWADYPGLGYDDKAIYLTSNQFSFGGSGQYPLIRIIPKQYLYINSETAGQVVWTDFWNITYPGETTVAWGVRPVQFFTTDDDYYFVVTRWWGDINSSVGIIKLTDALTNPALQGVSITTSPYQRPVDIQQLGGGDYPLEHQGVRISKEPVYRDGLLYITHDAKYNSVNGVRFLTVDVFSNAAFTDFIMGTDKHYHFYPAVAVNSEGDAVVSYTRSSADEYAGAYFTLVGGSSQEPEGTFTMQAGLDNYVKDYGTERNRWGDYMGAWVDPSDDYSFWVHSQYVDRKNTWGTWTVGLRPAPFDQPYSKLDKIDVDFGLSEVGEIGELQIVKIANIGNQDLVISNLSLSSDNFVIMNNISFPNSITRLDTLSLEISFQPKVHGLLSDTLRIISNSSISLDTKVALNGEGFFIEPASINNMYASTGRGAGSLGSILTIDLTTGEGTALGGLSGFKPLKSITINPVNKELVALNVVLGQLPTYVRLRANDGAGYIYKESNLDLSVIAFDKEGVLHGIASDNKYYLINYETLDTTFVAQLPIDVAAITFHPLTREMYAFSSETSLRDKLFKISPSGDTTSVGSTNLGKNIEAIGFDNEGSLYATVGRENQFSKLYKINAETVETTEIGDVKYRGVLGLIYAFDPAVSVKSNVNNIPKEYSLKQNYPNPFNPSTNISFNLPVNSQVKLSVYNTLGELVQQLINNELPAGQHTYEWNVSNKNLSSGIYIYTLNAAGNDGKKFSDTKKLILLK